jgi:redox-sensitive bicupin YhaK (pirin superfamily)
VRDVVTAPEYLDVTIPAGASFAHPTQRGHTVFAYAIDGRGTLAGRTVHTNHLAWFGDGDRVVAAAEAEALRFLLISGRPIREPIAWGGPIVMNTDAELQLAFAEIERGTFIKSRGSPG